MSNSIVWRVTLAVVIAAGTAAPYVIAAEAPPATTPRAEQPGPARFYGTISAVDLDARTFTDVPYAVATWYQLCTIATGNKAAFWPSGETLMPFMFSTRTRTGKPAGAGI